MCLIDNKLREKCVFKTCHTIQITVSSSYLENCISSKVMQKITYMGATQPGVGALRVVTRRMGILLQSVCFCPSEY